MIKFFICCICFYTIAISSLVSEEKSPPIIILKLDDFTRVSKGITQCLDFLKQENVKSSFGIIGHALDNPKEDFVKLAKQMHQDPLIELWHHGYNKRTKEDKIGEFETTSLEAQKNSLIKTIELCKNVLGADITAFGPHWSGTNKTTDEALLLTPQIKSVFYYGPKNKQETPYFVFKRVFVLEFPIFSPNFKFVKKKYEEVGYSKPYLALQGHPDQWVHDPNRFEEFKKIVLFFKEKGCIFMTPSEYLKSINR